jgi:hypothetical protein
LNEYAYAENNPALAADPTGHWLNIAIGAGIGAVAGFLGSVAGDVISGQPPDLGRAAGAGLGGAVTGGVCGATLGVACVATGAATSVIQYQTTAGATNPIDDPVPYIFNAAVGGTLGRLTGGAVLTRPAVTFSESLVPNVVERFVLNHPGWLGALNYSFIKSLLASGGQSLSGSLLDPAPAAAVTSIKEGGLTPGWHGR